MVAMDFLSQGVQFVDVAIGVVFQRRLEVNAHFLKDVLGQPQRRFHSRHADVEGGLYENLHHLVRGYADIQGADDVAAQQVQLPLGHQGGDGSQAALFQVQAGTRPDGAEQGFVNNPFQVGGQLVNAGQGVVGDVSFRHHPAHIAAGLQAVIGGSQGGILLKLGWAVGIDNGATA